jgi:hypothetical protein
MSEDVIVETLLEVPGMSVKETRALLLADLSFVNDIPDVGTTARDQVRNVVRACMARMDGFRKLLRVLNHLSDTIAYKKLQNLLPTDVPMVDPVRLRALTYLCDRSDHHDAMRDALRGAAGRFDRPLVFLYNGAADQGYIAFMEVLKRKTIYEGSGLNPDDHAVNEWNMAIAGKYENDTAFALQLRRNLAESVGGDRATSIPELNETMVFKVPGPAIVSTYVLASKWHEDSLKRIKAFLKFWDEWPQLTSNYPLVVCLGVHFDFEFSPRPRFPFALLSGWSQVNRIRSSVASIDLAEHKKVLGKRLPPFLGVEWDEAYKWTTLFDVTRIRRGLDAPVRKLYDRPGLTRIDPEDAERTARIPMDRMIDELLRLLET